VTGTVTTHPGAGRMAERLIRRSCRRLRAEDRDERYREWAAEVPAILEDRDTRPAILRSARAISYALGVWRCTHHPQLAAGRHGGSARRAAIVRVTRGVGIYLGVVGLFIGLAQAFGAPQGPWPPIVLVGLALCFDGFCLADLARASEVRYLPKWGWALACLVQTPCGGIMYLSAGRVRS
jgi:hypothetical protein